MNRDHNWSSIATGIFLTMDGYKLNSDSDNNLLAISRIITIMWTVIKLITYIIKEYSIHKK